MTNAASRQFNSVGFAAVLALVVVSNSHRCSSFRSLEVIFLDHSIL